jgi:hypothetical protein
MRQPLGLEAGRGALAKLVSKELMRKHVHPGSPPGESSLYMQDINLLHLPSFRDSRDHFYTLRGHSPPSADIAIRDNAKKREGLLEERPFRKIPRAYEQILLLETSLQGNLAFGLA